MDNVFINIVNMTINASWLIVVVIVLRYLLRKAPKYIHCILWMLVFVRLLSPVSFESSFSMIPSIESISTGIMNSDTDKQSNDIQSDLLGGSSYNRENDLNNNEISNIDNYSSKSDYKTEDNNIDIKTEHKSSDVAATNRLPIDLVVDVISIVWLAVLISIIMNGIISYIKIRKKVLISIRMKDNIWLCDEIDTPFVLGIVRPKIYIPSGLSSDQIEFVTEHELAHLHRYDNWIKPIAFILVAVHWFNPLVWLAYILFLQDIELACDERVIKNKNTQYKMAYSDALLNLSVNHIVTAASPLAFGETCVKKRIKNVLNYKKPALWIILVTILVCILAAVCFLTNPVQTKISKELDAAVSNAIIEENKFDNNGTYGCENHEVLAVSNSSNEVTVYLMVLTEEFSKVDGKLKELNAGHYPVAITFNKGVDNSFSLSEYWRPEDGSEYSTSIRSKFPIRAWSNALNTQKYYERQYKECVSSAEKYFKELPDANNISELSNSDNLDNNNDNSNEPDKMTLDDVKTYLKTFPDNSDELAKRGDCLVDVNGKIIGGISSWNEFIESYNDGKPSSLVISSVTHEGDVILEYLNYDGKEIYHVSDCSRDNFRGDGPKYLEQSFPYIKLLEDVTKNGNKSRLIVLTDDKDLTYDQYIKIRTSSQFHTDQIKVTSVFYTDDGIELNRSKCDDNSSYKENDFDESTILIPDDKVTSIVITYGNTGEKKTFAVTDGARTYIDIMELYHSLQVTPSDEEDRIGYGYKMELMDFKGKLIQTVIPYKDIISIDGKTYSYVSSEPDLMLKLSELF